MVAVVLVNVVIIGYVGVQAGLGTVSGQELALPALGGGSVPSSVPSPPTSVGVPSTAPPLRSTPRPTDARASTPSPPHATAPAAVRAEAPVPSSPATSAPGISDPSTAVVPHAVTAPTTTLAPSVNIAPSPDFLSACGAAGDNDGPPCVGEVTEAIDNARAAQGLPPMELPTNWSSLTPTQQLFVATNLERTARGLVPLAGEVPTLDEAAASAASAGSDPAVPSGFPATGFASNWAGWIGNPLEAMYYWMYDDGLGSPNRECTPSDPGACWGHRQNVLFSQGCDPCVMGGAWGTTGRGTTSVTELIVATQVPQGADFTWAGELSYLP